MDGPTDDDATAPRGARHVSARGAPGFSATGCEILRIAARAFDTARPGLGSLPCLIGPGDVFEAAADDVKFWEWPRGRIAQRSEEAATTTLLGRKERERKKDEDRFRKKEEKMEAGYAAVVLYIQRCQVAMFGLGGDLRTWGTMGLVDCEWLWAT